MNDIEKRNESYTKEMQDSNPDVSVDEKKEKQKEQEQDKTELTTETKLNELEKNIDEMIASKDYKKEYKKQLHEMKNEIHENKDKNDNDKLLTETTEKIEQIKKQNQAKKEEKNDNPSLMRRFLYGTVIGGFMTKLGWKDGKEWAEKKLHEKPDESKGSGFWEKAGTAMIVAGGFFFGKKTFSKIREWFAGENKEDTKNEDSSSEEQAVEKQPESVATTEIDPVVKQEWATGLQKNYPSLDGVFLNAWAGAIAAGKTNFEIESKRYYIDQDQFVSADKAKFDAHMEATASETAALGSETELPLQAGEKEEIEKAQKLEADMYEEHPSALWVLSRMISLGYVPSKLYKWRLANRILSKPWDIKAGMMKLIPSMRDRLVREKVFLIANGVNSHDYDNHLNRMQAIQNDIKTGKINSFNDIKTHYPDMVEGGPLEKVLRSKKMSLEKAQNKIGQKIDTYQEKEAKLRQLDNDMKALEQDAQKKYQALSDLDKQAEKDPAKGKQLRRDVEKITKEYNAKSAQIYAETGSTISKVSTGELARYERQFSTVNKLVKMNGGAGKFVDKVNAKGGRFMLRVGLAGLLFRGGSDIIEQGVLSKETALDAADFAASMVPFGGGVYDMGVAWNGKDLNGRTLSTADRWIRGSVGVVSLVLDVGGLFTFGAGNAASAGVKAGVKTGTKVAQAVNSANKVAKVERLAAKGTQVAANVYKGARFVSKGLMFGGLTYGVVVNAYDITVATTDMGKPVVEKYEAKNTENSTVQF